MAPQDNFFTIGGDSITGIQIVSRAAAEGIELTPADLFAHQVIAELAAVADARTGPARRGGDRQFPLTPYQRALLGDGSGAPSQVVELPVDPAMDPATAGRALQRLLAAHPALRLRIERTDDGFVQTVGGVADPEVALIELGSVPARRRDRAREQMIADIRAELTPLESPLHNAVLFDLGPGQRRLAWFVSDLAVDARSWPALYGGLRDELERVVTDTGPVPEIPTPLGGWAEQLSACGTLDSGTGTVDGSGYEPAPLALGGPDPTASVHRSSVRLPAAQSGILLDAASRAYRLSPAEVMAVGLVEALRREGAGRVLLDVEYDLRDRAGVADPAAVGPFAGIGVVPVDVMRGADADTALDALIGMVKDHCRAPGWLEPDERGEVQLLLRHLGELAGTAGELTDPVPETDGALGHRVLATTYLLDGGLAAELSCPQAGPTGRATLDRLAVGWQAALDALAEHCARPGAGSVGPTDFPLAGLDQDTLASFLAAVGGAEGQDTSQ